ncbi:MAG TPA: tRNA (guanosine(37)-N1)-methyltransferase TrmD [Rhizomicrobium sp.]|jgi:tRNA (guanine37-N1)-methyltransferase|nr:tRNA (guanosine(37)-N1)-methyltransferase TrmD [Rhizomicrobium sp.]
MTWRASVLTLFPEMFPGPLGVSLIGKAMAKELWSLDVRDIRDHGLGKHRTVDDTPAGGGPGMVMRADVASAAIDAARAANPDSPSLYLSPRGAPLSQSRVQALKDGPGAILLCGRFEGLDQRAIAARGLEEISLGDFVLAGGEIAAMAVIEAVVRLIPGTLGDAASPTEESFADGLLEYPQYTRPQSFENLEIPAVLTGGNHAQIAKWRRAEAETLTRVRRPDLWALFEKKKP